MVSNLRNSLDYLKGEIMCVIYMVVKSFCDFCFRVLVFVYVCRFISESGWLILIVCIIFWVDNVYNKIIGILKNYLIIGNNDNFY